MLEYSIYSEWRSAVIGWFPSMKMYIYGHSCADATGRLMQCEMINSMVANVRMCSMNRSANELGSWRLHRCKPCCSSGAFLDTMAGWKDSRGW